jgi:hypothetical protein
LNRRNRPKIEQEETNATKREVGSPSFTLFSSVKATHGIFIFPLELHVLASSLLNLFDHEIHEPHEKEAEIRFPGQFSSTKGHKPLDPCPFSIRVIRG